MTSARWTPIVCVLLLFLSACGGGNSFQYATLCKATGTLMINGQPAKGAMLIFVPAAGESGIDARGTRPRALIPMVDSR